MFKDRKEAGELLAKALADLKHQTPVVVRLPRGGVPLAFEVANALNAPLDLALVRKIGVPGQPEPAIDAGIDRENLHVIVNRDVATLIGAEEDYIQQGARKKLEEIEERRRRYFGGRARLALKGGTVIIVDVGVATRVNIRARPSRDSGKRTWRGSLSSCPSRHVIRRLRFNRMWMSSCASSYPSSSTPSAASTKTSVRHLMRRSSSFSIKR